MSTITLTVFFEDPFWVGVVECQDGADLQAARQIFGAEPAPGEVHEFVKRRLAELLARPLASVAAEPVTARQPNPKRAARAAAQALAQHGSSTKAQEALRLQIEQHKRERAGLTKAAREAEATRKRQLKLQKAKARHRGH